MDVVMREAVSRLGKELQLDGCPRSKAMDSKKVKKVLAGFAISGLVTSATLTGVPVAAASG